MKTSSLIYILVVNGFILFITAIDINPSVDVQCQLTTNLGSRSYKVNVIDVNINDSLVLNCSCIARNNGSFIYQWKREGKPLCKNATSLFAIKSITRYDAGKYECVLMNVNRTSKPCLYVNVSVNVRPSVRIQKILIGKKDEMICVVNGYPKPRIWMKINGHDVTNISYITNIQVVPPAVGTQKYKFVITINYRFLNANYTCFATNKYGTSNDTWEMNNHEQEKCPEFKYPQRITHRTVTVGQTFSLLCVVLHQSHRGLDYYNIWPRFKNLSNTKYTYRSYTTKNNVLVMNYTIFHVNKHDSRSYNCTYHRTAKKKCNNLFKKIDLVVKELPVTKTNIYVTIATSITGAVVGIGLLLMIYYMYLRRKRFESQRFYDSMPELRWDVFVSYSSKDFPWVKELCETLEQPPFNLTACLHERDWEIGRTVIDNMADSVYCSLRTLIILSKHYVESSYCMQELQIAMHCELGSKSFDKERLVVIKLDDVSLKTLPRALRQKSYLDFSSNEERKHFKAKLQRALPRREPSGETSGGNEMCDDNRSDCGVRVEDITDQQTELLEMSRS